MQPSIHCCENMTSTGCQKSPHVNLVMLKERNAYKNTLWSLEGDTGYVMPCLMEMAVLFKGCRHILTIPQIHRTVTAAGQYTTLWFNKPLFPGGAVERVTSCNSPPAIPEKLVGKVLKTNFNAWEVRVDKMDCIHWHSVNSWGPECFSNEGNHKILQRCKM